MRADMAEQPAVLERLLGDGSGEIEAAARELRRRRPRLVVFVARGSSDHAANFGRYLVERFLGVPACLAAPSVLTVYRKRVDLRGAAVIGVSQSGRSPDVVEYLAAARKSGAATLAMTNDAASPLARAAERVLLLRAGPELGIPATKTFTAQVAVLQLLIGAWSGVRALEAGVRAAPELCARALDSAARVRAGLAGRTKADRWIVLGRGLAFPVALEIALKLKEAAGVFAEGWSAADFLHGPAAAAGGAQVLLLRSGGPGDATVRRAAERLPAPRKAVWRIPFGERLRASELSAHFPLAVTGQLIALELGLARGLDPDRPAGLKKITTAR
jgi:glucosamine--fructose-6-phosphate aminotransferase (isomerizing)